MFAGRYRVSFSIGNAEDWTDTLPLVSPDGNPYHSPSSRFVMHLRNEPGAAVIIATLDSDAGTLVHAAGTLSVLRRYDAGAVLPVGRLHVDLIEILAPARRLILVESTLTVTQQVTRP